MYAKSVRLVYIHSDRSLGLVAERRSEEKKSGGPVEKKIHEFTCKQHVMHEQPVTRGPTITLVRVTLSLHTQTPNFSIIIGSSLSLTGIPCIPATCHPPRASPSIPLHLLTKLKLARYSLLLFPLLNAATINVRIIYWYFYTLKTKKKKPNTFDYEK